MKYQHDETERHVLERSETLPGDLTRTLYVAEKHVCCKKFAG